MLAEGSGPPVLLLHGSGPGTTAAAWAPLIAALAPHHRVIAPDLLGFGSSPKPEPGRSLRSAWTEQVLELVDSLSIESFAVVGNSAGGAIALSLACARPGTVTRVVAVGSMGVAMPLPAGLDALWNAESAQAVANLITFLAPSDASVVAREAAMRAQPWYSELFPAPRQRWVDDLALTREELAGIAAPVLLVHGAQDRIVPMRDSFLSLIEALPDVRGHVFGRCGHASPLEHTDEFNRLLTTFLETDR
ncbi:alpha/beta fold hydrolase [Solirubrobacter ginsenosidimutans]|uniref:Alpha/beta fold hydrolase n=1 Tax=Solirubrobacter ginsenosidimutans TaxID=490573 RepID=A0A9X3MR83_9ACTN|nr:alpha/beta hydrolase [Solirubrobacter ginsenosidimutans]MDA0159738.1 alpha/beta fold hydrolase [Solirubrobacter ginsenosidimutans]